MSTMSRYSSSSWFQIQNSNLELFWFLWWSWSCSLVLWFVCVKWKMILQDSRLGTLGPVVSGCQVCTFPLDKKTFQNQQKWNHFWKSSIYWKKNTGSGAEPSPTFALYHKMAPQCSLRGWQNITIITILLIISIITSSPSSQSLSICTEYFSVNY